MSSPQTAPAGLESVRRFVNTRNIEKGTDELSTPEGLVAWLGEGDGPEVTGQPVDLIWAREVREALRAALLANHDGADLDSGTLAVLNAAADRASLKVDFSTTGWEPSTRRSGLDGAIGQLLAIVVRAMADGTWRRLKVCLHDECRWAFYDHSNACSSKWCDMRVCGNRAKQKAWRARQVAAASRLQDIEKPPHQPGGTA